MKYRLEEIYPDEFEKLVISLCQELFGIGVVSFASGKDGGRDGLFTGTATDYPSKNTPWSGQFVIQAKHTRSPIASCSDAEFEKLIEEEVKKIKKLKSTGEVDCYLIFTNRKYTGVKGTALVQKIKEDTGVVNVAIVGVETIQSLLSKNSNIAKAHRLDRQLIPFDFSDQDIKALIQDFKEQLPAINKAVQDKVTELKYDYEKIDIDRKNALNGLGEEYYRNEIKARSLLDFVKIQEFLGDPINAESKEQYFDIAAELSNLISVKRSNFATFDEIFVYIYQYITDRATDMKGKRHIYTLLHYMYFECLIGQRD